jgi:hypothetical protein
LVTTIRIKTVKKQKREEAIMSSADDQYEQVNDQVSGDAPAGDAQDNDYVMRQGQKGGPIPVQSDNAAVEDPIDGATADSDEQLGMF